MNVLFITLDQFRGDCLSIAGHPVVRTPNLDALARQGVRLSRHYSQAAPCSPGRACLYTGTYMMTNRVVANGTPLDDRFDNVARAARRAGYDPTLIGYTDQSIDPRQTCGPRDERLWTYQGVLPGFSVELDLREDQGAWCSWLRQLGYDVPVDGNDAVAAESSRPEHHSVSAFLTDRLIAWLERQEKPWFAHASYYRPHPPYAAAGRWSRAHDPDAVPLPIAPADKRHPFLEAAMQHPDAAAPASERAMRRLIAQYFGMVSEVDDQLGRVWEALRRLNQWDDTMVVVTADHGEQLGDHGLIQKLGFLESSYHVVGIIRDPRHPVAHGHVVDAFTENVDILPTICEAMGVDVPAQCDGLPLTPFLRGETPPWWRGAAHWEFDWRDLFIPYGSFPWPWDRSLEQHHLSVLRNHEAAYVQFGDGSWCCFDLAADPTWRTEHIDPATALRLAQAMLVWRSSHADRTLTGMLLADGGIGRWPSMPDGWHSQG
ncbi:MAG: sulfatase-like hydrolase/transferase [Deltaproteobacteria bacterium]|nr:sulfatase-like hydrolase/transferase [Deltaproteobacteria bacterium]